MNPKPLIYAITLCLVVVGCELIDSPTISDNQTLVGPIAGLNLAENSRFVRGDDIFNNKIFTSTTGLGPIFTANSCASCHFTDGKGHPFNAFFRFGQSDASGNTFLDKGGPQLQDRALPGFEPETMPEGVAFSKLIAPAVTGLGYLQYVSDATIMALADENDDDGDGISGRPNWVEKPSYSVSRIGEITKDGLHIGRFGKKASAFDLLHQVALAYNQDIGITSIFEPIDTYTNLEIDPEISTQEVRDVVFYMETLKAPLRRNQDKAEVLQGEKIFTEIKCSSCHVPKLATGYSPIEALSNKEFYPYTDMLLHDMGGALDDGYTEGSAETAEWRTPPLWGLGLSKESQGGQYHLLHDGRAGSIEEAIEYHDGEAKNSRLMFNSLNSEDRKALIKFLESL
jgi:CxxC motif-containing protein (DUF1111 family)